MGTADEGNLEAYESVAVAQLSLAYRLAEHLYVGDAGTGTDQTVSGAFWMLPSPECRRPRLCPISVDASPFRPGGMRQLTIALLVGAR